MEKKILATCLIAFGFFLNWLLLELVLNCGDIMFLLFIPLIWLIVSTEDNCGRDYVERTGKCPICLDCPHNCPLEEQKG